ncbi:chemotaxis protein CheW [Anaerosinus massiliensis]|uniref:chemotaxis protein CheW n=1 Tax=Massilibacillus massiliensis TaxID=1806837 RepID=UPI000AD34767|nr:chemotaxis protein CheW [Massilibacillus massiliensis]
MDNREDLQILAFRLATEEYALPITKVKDINRIMPFTKVPNAPEFMEGIINLRGEIVPVVDIRKRFGLKADAPTDESRIVVVEVDGRCMGIIVDAVTEVRHVPNADIDLPPAAAKLDMKQVPGVGKVNDRLLILLDIEEIFSAKEVQDIKAMNGSL